MAMWTVIGFYDDNGQAFAEHVEATDQFAAMGRIGKRLADSELVIVGAVAGEHELHPPGDDNDKIATATDLADLADARTEA
jgi:hypothetical protein